MSQNRVTGRDASPSTAVISGSPSGSYSADSETNLKIRLTHGAMVSVAEIEINEAIH